MAVLVKKHYTFCFQGEKWDVPEALVCEKHGKEWVSLVPSNYSLRKLIMADRFDRSKKLSLKSLTAFEQLLEMRNLKSNLVGGKQDELFDGEVDAKPTTKKRKAALLDQETEIALAIPGSDTEVICLKASKVADSLCVQLGPSNLSILFSYLSKSEMQHVSSRAYSKHGKYVGLAAQRKSKKDSTDQPDSE